MPWNLARLLVNKQQELIRSARANLAGILHAKPSLRCSERQSLAGSHGSREGSVAHNLLAALAIMLLQFALAGPIPLIIRHGSFFSLKSMTDPIIAALIAAVVAVIGWFVSHLLSRRKKEQPSDTDIIDFLAICFTRPAFTTPFAKEVSEEGFIQAIEDTVTAIRTGKLLDRKDRSIVLREDRPYHQLQNTAWRSEINRVISLLDAIQTNYHDAVQQKKIRIFEYHGHSYMPDRDQQVEAKIDSLRNGALAAVASICREAGVPFMNPAATNLSRGVLEL